MGLSSAPASSNCVRIDATPPNISFVGSGKEPGVHQSSQESRTLVFANAVGVDDVSEVEGVEWCNMCKSALPFPKAVINVSLGGIVRIQPY